MKLVGSQRFRFENTEVVGDDLVLQSAKSMMDWMSLTSSILRVLYMTVKLDIRQWFYQKTIQYI